MYLYFYYVLLLKHSFTTFSDLLTIIDVDGFEIKRNTELCELNSPCLRSNNLDNPTPNYQDGERQNESHTVVNNSQTTRNNTNKEPINHNFDNDSEKDAITDKNEDSNKNGQVPLDEKVEDIPVRHRRSSPTLMRLFRLMYVKPSTTTVEDNEVTTVEDETKTVEDYKTTTNKAYTRQSNQNDYIDDQDIYKTFQDILHQINETLNTLDEKLSSFDLPERKGHAGFITIRIPIFFDSDDHRSKREVTENLNATKLENDTVNDNKTFVNTTANVTKGTNNTEHSSESQLNSTSDVISKIDSVLKDVQNEISEIKGIKDSISSDEKFKVGYIVASLENLELTLQKLAKRIHTRRSESVANKFLGEVKHSKKIVTNLMEYLRMHAMQNSE